MEDIRTRLATMDDYEGICRLIAQVDHVHVGLLPNTFQGLPGPARPKELIAHFVESKDADVILASTDTEIIGLLNLEKSSNPPYPMFKQHECAMIDNLVVDTKRRGQGVGSVLLRAAKQWAQAKGLKFLQTSIWVANAGAKQFYEKHGFQTLNQKIELALDNDE